MRAPACLGLGLFLTALGPAVAQPGVAGARGPVVVRPSLGAAAASGPRVIQIAARPVYGPPLRAIYGPPRATVRHAGRHRGGNAGFIGYPPVYQSAAEAAPAPAQAAPSGEYLRPRAAIVYNYAGGPPLWQGDAGYVAQPVIYNVQTVLRRYPLTGMEPHPGR